MNLRFRMKPTVVEAFQMTVNRRDDQSQWPHWMVDAWNRPIGEDGSLCMRGFGPHATRLILWTKNGDVPIFSGDWIICSAGGELYMCKPDVFARTYEPVE